MTTTETKEPRAAAPDTAPRAEGAPRGAAPESAPLAETARLEPPAKVLDIVKAVAPHAPVEVGRALDRLLSRMEPAGALGHRVEWLADLVEWLRKGGGFDLPPHATVSGRSSAARLWILVETLRVSPAWRKTFGRMLKGVLDETSALALFSRAGLPQEYRIFSEATDRLARSILPTPPDDADLANVLRRLFPTARAVDWIEEVPPTLVVELFDVAAGVEGRGWFKRQRADAAESVALVALRASTMGLEDDVRARSGQPAPTASPFFELAKLARQEHVATPTRFAEVAAACRAALGEVRTQLETSGVSVDLVFRLEFVAKKLERIERLIPVARGEVDGLESVRLFRGLLREAVEDTSVSALVATNMRLLARRIIERAGETGEHYITETRAEYHAMMRSAAGGGVLTAGTTVLKFLVSGAHLPLFFEGLFSSINYAASFLLMQALGFTLATKQPAMTAAAIAAAVDEGERQGSDERLVDLIARTSRSQLAAAIGNVGMVIPSALAVHFAWLYAFGAPMLGAEKARRIAESLSPIGSATIVYAAFTGVLLWASSIAAGWVDNWFVYRRIPEAIAAHRGLKRVLGAQNAARIARATKHGVAGVGGNVALGFALGMVPVFATFFGLPLDVRHVTLSTGALVFAGSTLGAEEVATRLFAEAALGIGVIGALNFGVSFALALFVAMRARSVPVKKLATLGWAVVRRLATRPLSFLRPPR